MFRVHSLIVGCVLVVVGTALAREPILGPPSSEPPRPADSSAAPLTLAALQELALGRNPTLVQAAAQAEMARGRALQSGLYPNPAVGYVGEQIGLRGSPAGEMQGVFIDQTIVTARRLGLNRAKFAQEVSQADWLAAAQHYRVANAVTIRFYQLLAMQRLLVVRANLVKIAEDGVRTTEELINVGAANRPDLLQARIEARQERVGLENARALYLAAWQQVTALVGEPNLSLRPLEGNLEEGPSLPDWDATLAHLLEASPEVQIARCEVVRTQYSLKREQVEPIPNIQVRVETGYNFEGRSTTANIQAGIRLPLFDKNQGNIRAAEAELARAYAELQRVELSLRQRLAGAFARYRTALAFVENYRKYNLPEAREAYELYLDAFRKRRAAYPQVLIAQRNYFQISVEYVEALEQLRRAEATIQGLLLVDGLDEPPGLPGEGRGPRREQNGGAGELPDPIRPGEGRSLENRVGNRANE
jgi:cobalt-zinc-cadmium efflux system outer membrane protein